MKRGEGKFQNDEEELGRADQSDTKINLVNKNDNQTEKKHIVTVGFLYVIKIDVLYLSVTLSQRGQQQPSIISLSLIQTSQQAY